MQFRPLKKDDIIVKAKHFTPSLPELVSIQFADETVTVIDTNGNAQILPFEEVDICEIIDPSEPIT